ncbi:hypothetical protein Syun_029760 [Stephania yunnanensis]|uniref:Uncharacterized protein n=1 Tax=Stephania yunnanensis TaxID=152371 RepID=A0AAP0E678_9MAGN
MRGSMAVLNFPLEMVKESLHGVKLNVLDQECKSPVLVLKKRHAMRRKSTSTSSKARKKVRDDQHYNANSNHNQQAFKRIENVLELVDLGADYLEELMTATLQNIVYLATLIYSFNDIN